MNWKAGLLQDLLHLLRLVEDMSPTNTTVKQHSSLLQYSLLAVPFTENMCKHPVKCITLLAYTADLLSFTNLSMKLAFVPTSRSHSCLCKGLCLQYGAMTHLPLSGILCVRSRNPTAHISPHLCEICYALSRK